MCLMLYVGTTNDLQLQADVDMTVEEVEESRLAVRRWFSLPFVHFVGAHTRCSCGFPSVMSESPIEYFDGIFAETADRPADVRSVRALIDLVRLSTQGARVVELYPVGDGEEAQPPKGTIELQLGALNPERFFFNERFMHIVRA